MSRFRLNITLVLLSTAVTLLLAAQLALPFSNNIFIIGLSFLFIIAYIWIDYPLTVVQRIFTLLHKPLQRFLGLLPKLPTFTLPSVHIRIPTFRLKRSTTVKLEYREPAPRRRVIIPFLNIIFPSLWWEWLSYLMVLCLIVGYFYVALNRLFDGYRGVEMFYVWQSIFISGN